MSIARLPYVITITNAESAPGRIRLKVLRPMKSRWRSLQVGFVDVVSWAPSFVIWKVTQWSFKPCGEEKTQQPSDIVTRHSGTGAGGSRWEEAHMAIVHRVIGRASGSRVASNTSRAPEGDNLVL